MTTNKLNKFVPVPTETLENLLLDQGYNRNIAGKERTMVRRINDVAAIKVYTSATAGEDEVRECGSDAIRVVLRVFTGNHKGQKIVYTMHAREISRVNRCGTLEGVLSRLQERITQAETFAQGYKAGCSCCGGAVFANSGICVSNECAEENGRARKGQELPASKKQEAFLRELCRKAGKAFPHGLTMREAREMIRTLLG